jgi:riboflavin biosynthesis pyrimidine reductase
MNKLETLYDSDLKTSLPLPPELKSVYGSISFPSHPGRPYVISNFVSTLDGVVSLDAHGKAVGDVISGSSQQDSIVMGLLRAVSDIVLVGAGTLRASPSHIWTPQYIFPPYADVYTELRERMGKKPSPMNVIVSASGDLDLSLPVFQSEKVPVLIVTTRRGVQQIKRKEFSKSIQIIEGSDTATITARQILKAIETVSSSCEFILIEGGPHLIGDFFADQCLDELFLTFAPQIAGRDSASERLGLVAEKIFAPEREVWGTLRSVKRSGSHLFLRYGFDSGGVR